MTGAKKEGRFGCYCASPFVPLMGPETGSFHTKPHHHTVEPKVMEQLVQAWLGLSDSWHAFHHSGNDRDKNTKVSST